MPSVTNIACGDQYTTAASIAFVYGSPGGYLTVENEPVFYSLAHGARGQEQWSEDYPGGVGNISIGANVIGVQVRNQTAGQVATVSAVLVYPGQPVPAPGAAGQAQVTPTNTIQVQHNGTVIGTEAALDFEDSLMFQWVALDDPVNSRIQVFPPRMVWGQVAANGTIIAGSTFTVNHSSTGVYVVSYTALIQPPPGPTVIPALGNSGAAPSGPGCLIQVSAESNAGFTIKTDNGSVLADEPWQFLAVGP